MVCFRCVTLDDPVVGVSLNSQQFISEHIDYFSQQLISEHIDYFRQLVSEQGQHKDVHDQVRYSEVRWCHQFHEKTDYESEFPVKGFITSPYDSSKL